MDGTYKCMKGGREWAWQREDYISTVTRIADKSFDWDFYSRDKVQLHV